MRELANNAPGVDYTKILCVPFICADPKSTKKTDGLTVYFALLGSALVKAVSKMLVKSKPDEILLN